MRRVYIICEGQTEENFIKEVFAPYFNPQIVAIQPLLVGKKGGALSYDRVKNFILNLAKNDTATYITTMFDYYALDTNFPGHNQLNAIPDIYKKVKYLEKKFRDDINSFFSNNRFFPYIQPHEFESLLFSDINEIVKADPGWNKKAALISSLSKIVNDYPNPEEINNSPSTSPSHRLGQILNLPKYRKVLHGATIAKNIGIDNIRQKCKHFDEWCNNKNLFP
ncbi:MAG: DUF4276 family protein [Campylobacter concisus]|uniref:DUF4276 family protein n=1 Tax=Campylobacter concisus (strain 13826) TaxID=360104 RepID=A7ZB38_CAMC1|nr:DUF4276 family protein [Campylobacter concisus]EAT99061.1 putative protein (DUF4276 domain) [Campylobacter concisus 13826]MBS6287129.1 DUF4276 family protein [Campylobacter concisus]